MNVSNSTVKRIAQQLFASTRGYETPFYNRVLSKKIIRDRFKKIEELRGTAYIISAPLGTGKTFLIDDVANDLDLGGKEKTYLLGQIKEKDLKKAKGDILFFDEGDIKITWKQLKTGLELIANHITDTGQTALILGDYCLRNPELMSIFPKKEELNHFEPLNREFLEGAIRQRLVFYIKTRSPEDIIEPELYDLLVPNALAPVASFRTIFSFLQQLTNLLPLNQEHCHIGMPLARQWVQQEFDPMIASDEQADFLNLLLDLIASKHPRGADLNQGWTKEQLFLQGKVDYATIEEFNTEIIEPFTRTGLLISTGIPFFSDEEGFVRRPEPFYPSIPLLLLAEE